MTPYPPPIEKQMRLFFETLSEKDRRRYAAIEARKLGRGGQKYIAEVLGCGLETIRRGLAELDEGFASGPGDHDFNSFADGLVVPHGIYDLARNTGFITIGTCRDTSAFAADCLRRWWSEQGRREVFLFDWPEATSLLVLCDGGGSNSSRHYVFKEELQHLADEFGLRIRIAHYPPYCSKYNPIEHRLFPHVTRACQGVIFKSVEMVKRLMQKTRTRSGLRVKVSILDKVYEVGKKAGAQFKENMRIVFDEYLPKWNYVAVPAQMQNASAI